MTGEAVLVTGAAGLIGGALTRALLAAGRRVIATDARPADLGATAFSLADLEDYEALAKLAREASAVVHCGAASGPMVIGDDPRRAFAVNVVGSLNVVEAARRARARRVLSLSSIAVYGDQEDMTPVTETAPLRATDVYGASKVAMETALRAYRNALATPVAVLRVASVYGPGRKTACYLRSLIESARSAAAFPLPSEAPGRRQFVHVDDVVRAIVLALDAPTLPEFAYNVGGGSWLSEREVAVLAASVLPELALRESGQPAGELDGRMGPLDGALAWRDFRYRPEIGLAAGVLAYSERL